VTIDSSSATIPSVPLIDLLGFAGLVSWVDEAHAAGIETYISGGMSSEHIELATCSGVDGVGIGYWIHHYDPVSRSVGPLDGDKVKQAIRVRNDAEASARGCAARLLARLHAESPGVQPGPDWGISHAELLRAVSLCDEEGLAPLVARARAIGFV